MGAALCTCGGPEDPGLNSLRYDRLSRLQQARVVAKYGALPPKYHHLQSREHSSLLLSRGETYTLSDDVPEEGGEESFGGRHGTAQAYADAFRAKLQEPPLSPRSKFELLITRTVPDSSVTPTESSGDSGSNNEESVTRKRPNERPDAWNSYAFPDAAAAADEEDIESVTEEDWKQRANPLITIIVPPGPCGLVLQVDRDESGAPVVDGFVRKQDGKKSTIENSGLIKKGSILCAINDIDVTRMPLKEVLRTLNLSSHLERAFTFRSSILSHNLM